MENEAGQQGRSRAAVLDGGAIEATETVSLCLASPPGELGTHLHSFLLSWQVNTPHFGEKPCVENFLLAGSLVFGFFCPAGFTGVCAHTHVHYTEHLREHPGITCAVE